MLCYKRPCCTYIAADSERMPRGKNKKKFSTRSNYQSENTREVNPFELKVNHQKHEVLGRKIAKTDKGMPGVSRSKAMKKVGVFTCGVFIVCSSGIHTTIFLMSVFILLCK